MNPMTHPWDDYGIFTSFYLHGWLISMVNVGKYYHPHMDPMGNEPYSQSLIIFGPANHTKRGPKCLQQNDHLYTGLTLVGGKEDPIWNLLG